MLAPIIFGIVIATVFIAVVAYSIQAERKRKAAIAAVASEMGLAFSPILAGSDLELFNSFPLANHGHSRSATSSITADSGELKMVLFDYQYTVGGGKNKQTRSYHVVMATSRTLDLPQFSLSPESFFHRLADFLGFKDIDFEEDQPFSDQFQLKGANESAIRNFFTAGRRAAMLPLGQVYLEGRSSSFIFYRTGKQRDAAQVRSMLEEGFTIYSKLGDQHTSGFTA